MKTRPSRRRNKRVSNLEVFAQRIWRWVGRVETVGLALLSAGVVVALAPMTSGLENPSIAWFVTALHDNGTARTAASLVLASAVLLAGFGTARLLLIGSRRRLRRGAPLIGAALMVGGAMLGLGGWFAGHFYLPVSRFSIAAGQSMQSIPTVQVGRTLKVMLALRTKLISLDTERGTAKLEFFRAGETEGVEETVQTGEPLVVGNYRLALVGFDFDKRHLQATVQMAAETSVPSTSVVGGDVQFAVDGPKFIIRNIARNYMGVLGPAALLEDEEGVQFWVFERTPSNDLTMTRGISVSDVRTAPMAVFAVSSAGISSDIAIASLLLFLLGMALFLGFPDPHEDSLNELGSAREKR